MMNRDVREDKDKMDWGSLMEAIRHERCIAEEAGDWQAFYSCCIPHCPAVGHQLSRYLARLTGAVEPTVGENKILVTDTRNALRFGLSFVSIPSEEDRARAQKEAIKCKWDVFLLQILSQSRGESKCRLFSAQLLSNLLTDNSFTAKSVVSKTQLAPSDEIISNRIRESLSDDTVKVKPCQSPLKSNWVDMMLCAVKSNNREAFGAIVAAIHNCLVSLGSDTKYATELSHSSLLISTLLRQLVSASSIQSSLQGDEKNGSDPTDSTTEWITLLVTKLIRQGTFPDIYAAAGGGAPLDRVLPEHVVLLHCLRSEVERPSTAKLDTTGRCGLLGIEGDSSIVKSHLFLVQLWSMLQAEHLSDCDSHDYSLQQSAAITILYILAETLAEDTDTAAAVRAAIGNESSFLSLLCQSLGNVYDTLAARNNGRKSRDMLVHEEEQAQLTALVRVLGNLCFRCRENQDRLRSTWVPIIQTSQSRQQASPLQDRTGLHVLLSCTSYAHACFTLREWAVVAIRNVLDGNLENQALVEELEAQQPVQSQALGDMGIKVNLDAGGKVSVEPLEDIQEDEEEEPKS